MSFGWTRALLPAAFFRSSSWRQTITTPTIGISVHQNELARGKPSRLVNLKSCQVHQVG